MASTLKVDILQDSGGNNLVTSNGSGVVTAAGFGKIGQIVQTVKVDTFSTTSTSMVDITGFSVSITPSSTSSKILVVINVGMLSNSAANGTFINLLRGTTNIVSTTAGGATDTKDAWNVGGGDTSTGSRKFNCPNISYLDSPSSSSSTTYKCQLAVNGGTGYFNRWALNNDHSGVSTITAMEVLP